MLMAVPKGIPVARDGSSEEVVVSNRDGHDVSRVLNVLKSRITVSDAVSMRLWRVSWNSQ